MPAPIEDYALLGDCETAALVSRAGSIDWLCWPRFDSDACFAALLGAPGHGRWLLAPRGELRATSRRYRTGTLILETDFETDDGAITVIDFMPLRGANSDLVRIVRGRCGRVPVLMELVIRFDFGATVPWVYRVAHGDLCAVAGPHALVLRTSAPLSGHGLTTHAECSVGAGETLSFVLTHCASHLPLPTPVDPEAALESTAAYWRGWLRHCSYAGPHADLVHRSLIVLKALTYRPTGGIVAAATTSLPEAIGGVRNWDYRYCWLRDSTFTLLALTDAGFLEEAQAWRDWLLRAVAGSPEQVQIMYGVAGERRLTEFEIPWLPGYEGSRPVRIGNAAAGQRQLDVIGEVMDALYHAHLRGLGARTEGWALAGSLLAYLETIWREPDEGFWEVRGGRRHFVHSKVMAWVAFRRGVQTAERLGLAAPVERWRAICREIHAEVCREGYDAALGSFVQSYGAQQLDASLLLLPLVGFLPHGDPRMRGTVAAIEQRLLCDGLVRRYDTAHGTDGLPPGEGAFLACSFWLADNYCLQGRLSEATALFERLLGLCNDVGLLAEEFDARAGRMLGNFPQAFSHVALVATALNLHRAAGPADERAQ